MSQPRRTKKNAGQPGDDVSNLVGHVTGNAMGPHLFADPVRLFADPDPGPDETSFHQPNVDAPYYKTGYYATHLNQIQQFPPPLPNPPRMDLAQVLGPNLVDPILKTNSVTFHAVGDTGASSRQLIRGEAAVADAMATEVQNGGDSGPAFMFHLGDVVYSFGESQYYYDQFYEPFRAYDRPIFAIPGNHDGAVYGPSDTTPVAPTLDAFLRNFCANATGPSPDAGGIVRTTMNQPGVYFTLDTPCASIIGLYSNVLEGPGVISSQKGMFPLPDDQLTFLGQELARLAPDRRANKRAIFLAVHHPPVSFDAVHGSSPTMANEIDEVCQAAGLWPDVVLSGHAHLYQRFSRSLNGRVIPYVVAGSGGHLARRPRTGVPASGSMVGNYEIAVDPVLELGYLTITVTMGNAPTITVDFRAPSAPAKDDNFTLDLTTGTLQ